MWEVCLFCESILFDLLQIAAQTHSVSIAEFKANVWGWIQQSFLGDYIEHRLRKLTKPPIKFLSLHEFIASKYACRRQTQAY